MIKISKQTLCLFFLVFLITFSPSLAQTQPEYPIEVERLSERTTVFSMGYLNTIVLTSAQGLVVVDTSRTASAGKILRERIEQELGRSDFLYVINTHHHWDHTGGNAAFRDVVHIGHQNIIAGLGENETRDFSSNSRRYKQLAARFEASAQAQDDLDSSQASRLRGTAMLIDAMSGDLAKGFVSVPPEISFSDSMTLNLGDLTLKLRYFGNLHSESDIIIHVPEEDIVLMGDLFSTRRLMFLSTRRELDVPQWLNCMDYVLKQETDAKRIISGHTNDDITIEEFAARRSYLATLWEGISQAVVDGLKLDTIKKQFDLQDNFPKLAQIMYEFQGIDKHIQNIELIWRHFVATKSAAISLEEVLNQEGLEAALAFARNVHRNPNGEYHFLENEFVALGQQLELDNRQAESVEVFKLAAEFFPASFVSHLKIGENQLSAENVDEAIRSITLASKIRQDNFVKQRVESAGRQLFENQQYDYAIRVMTMNTRAFPDSWDVFEALAEIQLEAGQHESAIENYRRSLELNPDNSNARQMLEQLQDKQ